MKDEIKKIILDKQQELDCDLWDFERHLVFNDFEVWQYLEENEYDIKEDDLALFQKFWNKTSDFTESLKVKYGESICEIIQELKREYENN